MHTVLYMMMPLSSSPTGFSLSLTLLPLDSGPVEPPSTYLWALFLLAQHYDQIGDHVKALKVINEAIDHTPTDVQLYMLKAKILKVFLFELEMSSLWLAC